MPALIPAIIGGAAAVGGALITSHAANNAANTAANTAAADNALQSQIYNSNKALETPYITSGNQAEGALNGFLGLGGDPAAVQKAFNDYLNSTGYQFALNQGENAAMQDKAARGQLDSGGTLKALDQYGTGLAQQYGQQYINNLQGLTQIGAGSANALAQTGQNYANASNSNSNSAATAQINAGTASANAFSGAINQAGTLFGNLAGNAFGGGASGASSYAPMVTPSGTGYGIGG